MTKSSKITLGVIGVAILALLGGFLGAQLFGGGSASASTSQGSFISDIKSRGQLRVGVAEAAPMTTMKKDANGVAGGPLTLPLQNLAKQLGVKYVPVPATWDNIVAGLQAGRYDFAAYLDNTLVRATSIQFSNPVLTYQVVFLVPSSSPYSSSSDIIKSGKPIATAKGAAANTALTATGGKLLELDSYTNATAALKANRAVAVSTDLPTAEGIIEQNPGLKIVVPDPIIYQSGAGYGMPNDVDPRSAQLVNIAILDAQDYGELSAAYSKVGYREINSLGDWQKQ